MLNGKVEVYAKFLIDPKIVGSASYGEVLHNILSDVLPEGITMVDYQTADSDSKLITEKYVNYLLDYYMNAPYGDELETKLVREPPMSLLEFIKYDTNRQFGIPKDILERKENNNG